MKKLAIFIVMALLVLCVAPVYASDIPAFPHAFYGSVEINDAPAPVGTSVEARGEGVAPGRGNPTITSVPGIYGTSNPYEPRLIVQGDIQDGTTIFFYVNGVSTGQTATWHSGETTPLKIDLVSDVTAQKVETVPAGRTDYVIDFKAEAGTTITVDTIGEVTITVQKYADNPHPGVALPADMLPRFIDIEIDDLDQIAWPMHVEQTYTNDEIAGLDESSLVMYYFKAAAWHECSDTGVYTANNIIWADMTRDELSGSPIAFGEAVAVEPEPEPEPEPTVGGGGAGPEITRVTLTGIIAWPSLRVDANGTVQSTCCLTSSDGRLTLDITEGTVILDSEGNALTYLSTSHERYPPKAPEGKVVVAAYNLTPDGANFDPAIGLTVKYDPATLPEGCAEKDLCISYWDGEKCCDLETTCNVKADTVSCQVSHFTVFAIIATTMPAAPAPAAFTISELSIGPAQVQPKEAVTIIASVANTGSTEGTYSVVLKINGVKEAEKSVTIAAGGSQDVSFSVAREELGTYAVVVDGLSGSFTVVGAPAPAPAPVPAPPPVERINWPLIGGIIAGVVVVGLLIFFLVRRRRAY